MKKIVHSFIVFTFVLSAGLSTAHAQSFDVGKAIASER